MRCVTGGLSEWNIKKNVYPVYMFSHLRFSSYIICGSWFDFYKSFSVYKRCSNYGVLLLLLLLFFFPSIYGLRIKCMFSCMNFRFVLAIRMNIHKCCNFCVFDYVILRLCKIVALWDENFNCRAERIIVLHLKREIVWEIKFSKIIVVVRFTN